MQLKGVGKAVILGVVELETVIARGHVLHVIDAVGHVKLRPSGIDRLGRAVGCRPKVGNRLGSRVDVRHLSAARNRIAHHICGSDRRIAVAAKIVVEG